MHASSVLALLVLGLSSCSGTSPATTDEILDLHRLGTAQVPNAKVVENYVARAYRHEHFTIMEVAGTFEVEPCAAGTLHTSSGSGVVLLRRESTQEYFAHPLEEGHSFFLYEDEIAFSTVEGWFGAEASLAGSSAFNVQELELAAEFLPNTYTIDVADTTNRGAEGDCWSPPSIAVNQEGDEIRTWKCGKESGTECIAIVENDNGNIHTFTGGCNQEPPMTIIKANGQYTFKHYDTHDID